MTIVGRRGKLEAENKELKQRIGGQLGKYECPMITIEKRGLLYYVSDNQTNIVGKGKNRDAAILCYHRGVELLQRRSAGLE